MRALAIGCALIIAGDAAAQPAEPPPDPYPEQTLAVDAATLAAAAAVALTDVRDQLDGPPTRFETFAGSWYLLANMITPAVHFAHRRRIGWLSLGVRFSLPLLASGVGTLAYCMTTIEQNQGFESGCENVGLPAGMVIGTAGAAALDALYLSDGRVGVGETDPETWYGWQPLLVDAVGVGVGAYFAHKPDRIDDPMDEPIDDTLEVAIGMYLTGFVATPWIHAVHGRPLRALGSFGLRLTVPALAAGTGVIGWCMGTAGAGSGSCTETGAALGMMSGSVLMSVIDAFVLSWEPAALEPRHGGDGPPGMTWIPGLALEPGGARLTLSSLF